MNVDKSEQRIRKMFAEIASRYDLMNHVLSGGVDYYWRWRTVRAAGPAGDAPILDVCTGTGDLAIAFWKKSRGRTPVVGTDFTHNMLRLATGKSAKRATTNAARRSLQFLEADTLQLPFADNRFQTVSVAFGLRNVSNAEQGLREMTRVCATGGRVLVLEFSVPANPLLRAIYLFYFRRILPRIGQWLSRDRESAYAYLPQSVCEFNQAETVGDLMQRCGLQSIDSRTLTCGIATLYLGVKPKPDTI